MPRKRPRSLDSKVVMQARELEKWVYIRGEQWKKKFRYSLVDEYRKCISKSKDEIITAFEMPNRWRARKQEHYAQAAIELAKAESRMDLMLMPEIGVMSDKEWAQAAAMIDDIRIALTRLTNSLNAKGIGGSDCPDCGMERETADYKDA